MPNIVIEFELLEIIEKTISKFGTGAHILVSKEYLGKNVKIVVGKSEVVGKKLKIEISNSEILERKISKFGTGAHVIVPKEHIGKNVKILVEKEKVMGVKNE